MKRTPLSADCFGSREGCLVTALLQNPRQLLYAVNDLEGKTDADLQRIATTNTTPRAVCGASIEMKVLEDLLKSFSEAVRQKGHPVRGEF
jgi:hypothetical protein